MKKVATLVMRLKSLDSQMMDKINSKKGEKTKHTSKSKKKFKALDDQSKNTSLIAS